MEGDFGPNHKNFMYLNNIIKINNVPNKNFIFKSQGNRIDIPKNMLVSAKVQSILRKWFLPLIKDQSILQLQQQMDILPMFICNFND